MDALQSLIRSNPPTKELKRVVLPKLSFPHFIKFYVVLNQLTQKIKRAPVRVVSDQVASIQILKCTLYRHVRFNYWTFLNKEINQPQSPPKINGICCDQTVI